jgi:hypothetical protein
MINLKTGNIAGSCEYLLDLVYYAKGDIKVETQELPDQIRIRMERGMTEVPASFIY